MWIFKCNLIVTSSAPLISTSNVGMLSDEPSGAPSIALTYSHVSTPSSETSRVSLLLLSCASSVAFKENSKVASQVQH